MVGESTPKCVCGATMVQAFDDVQNGNLTLAIPNGKYSCWPCSEIRRELLSACKEVLNEMRAWNGEEEHYENGIMFPVFQQLKAAIAKAEGNQ